MTSRPLVSVIDDDESVRESLPDLLKELGYDAEAFSSALAFLRSEAKLRTACLILDINMPGMSGPEMETHMVQSGTRLPVIYITGRRDEAKRLDLLKHGAIECLFKPFSDTALQHALTAAIQDKSR